MKISKTACVQLISLFIEFCPCVRVNNGLIIYFLCKVLMFNLWGQNDALNTSCVQLISLFTVSCLPENGSTDVALDAVRSGFGLW